ncbi:Uncharacterised protein [Collinsella intestinalis]|nr:Uncharacterised protein [Collinsella intestinalis]
MRTPKFERNIKRVPAANAMENMPACLMPASWVATTVSTGKTMPHAPVPTVFHR